MFPLTSCLWEARSESSLKPVSLCYSSSKDQSATQKWGRGSDLWSEAADNSHSSSEGTPFTNSAPAPPQLCGVWKMSSGWNQADVLHGGEGGMSSSVHQTVMDVEEAPWDRSVLHPSTAPSPSYWELWKPENVWWQVVLHHNRLAKLLQTKAVKNISAHVNRMKEKMRGEQKKQLPMVAGITNGWRATGRGDRQRHWSLWWGDS